MQNQSAKSAFDQLAKCVVFQYHTATYIYLSGLDSYLTHAFYLCYRVTLLIMRNSSPLILMQVMVNGYIITVSIAMYIERGSHQCQARLAIMYLHMRVIGICIICKK